jgi:hypothetical protein
LRRERAAYRRGDVRLEAGDAYGWHVDDATDLLGDDGKKVLGLNALGDERCNRLQRSLLKRAFHISDHGAQAEP